MKAAVFYESEDIRLEDVPEPEIGDDDVSSGSRPAASAARTSSTTTASSPLGTADGKGPLILGHEFCRRGRRGRASGGEHGLAEGDRVAVNPVQSSCNACDLSRSGKAALLT